MRLTILRVLLFMTICLVPVEAQAAPIFAFIGAVGASLIGAPLILGASAAYAAGYAVGTFLATTLIGNLILNLAVSFALNALFAPDAASAATGGQSRVQPKPADLQGNFTVDVPPRFMMMGPGIIGGHLTFGEVKAGTLFKQIAHCDSEMRVFNSFYLNDVEVVQDSNGFATNKEFALGDGATVFYHLENRSGTIAQPVQARLHAEFTEWTENHVGAGVCDTLLTISPIKAADRQKILRHRGILGVGEPDLKIEGVWSRNHDPRIQTSIVDDPDTWPDCDGNPILMLARHRMDVERFANDPDDINWDRIAEQADLCDELILNRYGEAVKRYTAALLINKNDDQNIVSENALLAAIDGIRHQDVNGKLWFRCGVYYPPTITLYQEDLFQLESSSAKDGETDVTHLFAKYTEPAFQYKEQASAVFVSPDWSDGEKLSSKEFAVPAVINHTQAVRLCKAAMYRQNASVGLTGIFGFRAALLREERFVTLSLENDPALSGVYEIASVDEVQNGKYSVPLILVDPEQWTLLEGEEGERPNFNVAVITDTDIDNIAPVDMNIFAASVGVLVRFVAIFPVPAQNNLIVQIQQRIKGVLLWEDYSVRTEDGAGASTAVSSGVIYEHRWRITTLSGAGSDWSGIVEVAASVDASPPGDFSNVLFISSEAGEVLAAWDTPSSNNYAYAAIYRRTVSTFDAGALITQEYGLPNTSDSWSDEGLAADDYYYWIEPVNGSGIAGNRVGPIAVTVA